MVAVEGCRRVVARVDDQCSRSVLARPGDGSNQRVAQQIGTEPATLLGSVEGEPGEEENRHRIGLAAAQP